MHTDEVEKFYVNLFKKVFEAAVNFLLQSDQSPLLQMLNLLHCFLKDQAMLSDGTKAMSKFYNNDFF